MKKFISTIAIFICLQISAQTKEELMVQQTIEEFFIGFHAQDSIKIKSVVNDQIILQTIINEPDGSHKIKTDDFSDFLISISKIPSNMKFEEKIMDYSIQIDGPMATAWTKYKFWINGELSHCGVNSFQLLQESELWKIIYLIDTRRKEDCK
ncbi:nuclear transport factor 2 family protein [Aurantibacter sp.]|uniref:nuclear transport factor 2 family protein n=1 Tax=Aurantibacter sp. TaxID=2807103 RepID=UPI0032661011